MQISSDIQAFSAFLSLCALAICYGLRAVCVSFIHTAFETAAVDACT